MVKEVMNLLRTKQYMVARGFKNPSLEEVALYELTDEDSYFNIVEAAERAAYYLAGLLELDRKGPDYIRLAAFNREFAVHQALEVVRALLDERPDVHVQLSEIDDDSLRNRLAGRLEHLTNEGITASNFMDNLERVYDTSAPKKIQIAYREEEGSQYGC